MDARLIVIQLDAESFQRWVGDGIIEIPTCHQTGLPVVWSGAHSPDNEGDSTSFLIQLPTKYGRALSTGATIYALIDEAKVISLPTEALTIEWESRMKNLGEEWLPFSFMSDWIRQSQSEDPPLKEGMGEIESDLPSAGGAPAEEILGKQPKWEAQSEPSPEGPVQAVPGESDSGDRSDPPANVAQTEPQPAQLPLVRQTAIPGLLSDGREPKPRAENDLNASEPEGTSKTHRAGD